MNTNIVGGLDLVSEATDDLNLDDYPGADRKAALRGFELLAEAVLIGEEAPSSQIPELDRAHVDLVNALAGFASSGVEAFTASGPAGEIDYIATVIAAQDFLAAFDTWAELLGSLIE